MSKKTRRLSSAQSGTTNQSTSSRSILDSFAGSARHARPTAKPTGHAGEFEAGDPNKQTPRDGEPAYSKWRHDARSPSNGPSTQLSRAAAAVGEWTLRQTLEATVNENFELKEQAAAERNQVVSCLHTLRHLLSTAPAPLPTLYTLSTHSLHSQFLW